MHAKLCILLKLLPLVQLCSSFGIQSRTVLPIISSSSSSQLGNTNSNNNFDDDTYMDPSFPDDQGRRSLMLNTLGVGLILSASGVASAQLFRETLYTPTGFQRLATTQYIAALGDPKASNGNNANDWGVWTKDPGPRGVWLRDYDEKLVKTRNTAPSGWTFDPNDWWLDEHGLIMEAPQFPITPGRYLVTGYRDVITGLTISPDGSWNLDEGTLYDVTHLPCRSARYSPVDGGNNGGPQAALLTDFPVSSGAIMPEVAGCQKQDYAVLFLIGKAIGKEEL
ncbi:hypothetical protein MPSEU_000586700 [Mayamaea pseudoterrestris]|nr:hypothetical protein MPSEU_000586700 [Mayamaea pseudoterrestris]